MIEKLQLLMVRYYTICKPLMYMASMVLYEQYNQFHMVVYMMYLFKNIVGYLGNCIALLFLGNQYLCTTKFDCIEKLNQKYTLEDKDNLHVQMEMVSISMLACLMALNSCLFWSNLVTNFTILTTVNLSKLSFLELLFEQVLLPVIVGAQWYKYYKKGYLKELQVLGYKLAVVVVVLNQLFQLIFYTTNMYSFMFNVMWVPFFTVVSHIVC